MAYLGLRESTSNILGARKGGREGGQGRGAVVQVFTVHLQLMSKIILRNDILFL